MEAGSILLHRECGIEIWKQNSQYLILDRFSGYGKFYRTYEEVCRDDYLVRKLFGVKIKHDPNPLVITKK